MTVQVLKDAVTMTRAEYEDLVDSRDHALALRDIASGSTPMIADEDMDAYLAAPTPLAFWRKHRNMTQAQLAEAAEVSQPFINQIENGHRHASVETLVSKIGKWRRAHGDSLLALAACERQ